MTDSSPVRADTGLHITSLSCEHVADPLGVDIPQPRLSWLLESQARGQRQTAYQVQVASSLKKLQSGTVDRWDSGTVSSDDTLQVRYAGQSLSTGARLFWRARVWDGAGKASSWSQPAQWTMGVLRDSDWAAQWVGANKAITPAPATLLLRHTFTVKPTLSRAIAFVCGLGQYEMSVNGRKVGEDLLAPGWTKYDKTCLYDTRDLTKQLKTGRNTIGLFLGNGMYNVEAGRYTKFTGSFGPLQAICMIRLEYADGSVETIGTDSTWRTAAGPITFSSVYGGEDYDARLLPTSWNLPTFNDTQWNAAVPLGGPGGRLRGLGAAAPPIHRFETFNPVSTRQIRPGVVVYDLGQNATFIPQLAVHGTAGTRVKITPAELLNADGSVDRGSVGGKESYWQYTLNGSGKETYLPKFFYHGCRYLQVERTASPGTDLPTIDSLSAVVIGSSSESIGTFSCSNDLFNRIFTLVRWAQRSNMVSVLTDCPHRERLGWLEETHLNGPALRYNFDLEQFFSKITNDMVDSQTSEGLVPDIAPEYIQFEHGFRDSPEWGSALFLVPWQQYQFCGDATLLKNNYKAMQRYLAYLTSKAHDHILDYGLGDWYDIGPNPPGYAQLTPVALTATAFYYQGARIVAETAALLNEDDDRRKYGQLAQQIQEAFNKKFWNPTTGQYATGSQCANAIPLVMHLAPPAQRPLLVQALVDDIARHGNAFTAGDVGYRYLLQALAEGGRSDIIFAMNNQSEKPGYGYQLKKGATSLTEAWDANPHSSQNHFMLGQIIEWFHSGLGGIRSDPTSPGFQKIQIQPSLVGDLKTVSTRYQSVRGVIVSDWKRNGTSFTLHISIPPNTSAIVGIPAVDQSFVQESGKPVRSAEGVRFARTEGKTCFYEIASGAYTFTSRLAMP